MDHNDAPKESRPHFWDILCLVSLLIIVFVCCYLLLC